MSAHPGKICLPALFFALLFINSISGGQAGAQVSLTIGGTGGALGPMKLLAAAFHESHPDIEVVVLPSLGSSGGVEAALKGAVDIGLSSRPLKKEEQSPELQIIEYSRTPLAPVVNPGVKITGVDHGDLVNIYKGEIGTWSDGTRLRPVVRPAGESDTLTIKNISSAMESAVDAARNRKGMLMALTDQENADMIEKVPGAFGFLTLTQIISENRKVKILSYNGIFPSVHSLSDRSYPLYKSLFFITRVGPSAPARLFLDFVRSDRGRRILEDSGNLYVMDVPVR